MKCATSSCNEQAVLTVFWPGQTATMCAVCALRAQNVAYAMGFTVEVRPLELAAGWSKAVTS